MQPYARRDRHVARRLVARYRRLLARSEGRVGPDALRKTPATPTEIDEQTAFAPIVSRFSSSAPTLVVVPPSSTDDEDPPVEALVMDGMPVRRRRRRRTRPRAKTIQIKRITRADLRAGHLAFPPVDIDRPKTRGDCSPCSVCQEYVDAQRSESARSTVRLACGHSTDEARNHARPCGWVSCRSSLYLDINPETGSIKFNYPDLEPWELGETCALDVADRGGITLEEVGAVMNLTRERIRQVEVRGLVKLKMSSPTAEPSELGARPVNSQGRAA